METDSGQRATMRRREGARGRRERRLRAEARIRHQLCRDAVRVASHRGGEGYMAREGEVCEQHYGLRAQKRPLPGTRPPPLLEVLPQLGAQRHAVDQIVDVPGSPTLDGPVPLIVEQLVDVLQLLDALIPLRSFPTLLYARLWSRTWTFQFLMVDGGEGLLGLHPGQSSPAFSGADHRSVTAEQIVGIVVFRFAGCCNSSFFSHFSPKEKKCEVGSAPESEGARQCQLIHAGGSARIGFVVGVTHSCSAGRVGGGRGGSEEGAREQEEEEEE